MYKRPRSKYKAYSSGKKMFKPKRFSRIKRTKDKVIEIVAMVVICGIVGFVTFSAIKPISEFIEARRNGGGIAEETTAPAVTEPVSEPVTTPAITAVFEETSAPATLPPTDTNMENGSAMFRIQSSDLADLYTLADALDKTASQGYGGVVIPMKLHGGKYTYRPANETIRSAPENAFLGNMSAAQIASAAEERGLKAYAYVSVLADNNRYGSGRAGAYRTEDGDIWFDGDPSEDGRTWLCPYDIEASDMICSMLTELGEAGFKGVICDDVAYPRFRESDLDLLGEDLHDPIMRTSILTSLVRKMTNAAGSKGAELIVCEWAGNIISGTSEMFDPGEMGGTTLAVRMNGMLDLSYLFDESYTFGTEQQKMEVVYRRANELSEGLKIIPVCDKAMISRLDMDRICEVAGADIYIAEE